VSASERGDRRLDVLVLTAAPLLVVVGTGGGSGSELVVAGLLAVVLATLLVPPGRRFGVLLGVFTVAGIDALPGYSFSSHPVYHGFNAQDVVVIVLACLLAVENVQSRATASRPSSSVIAVSVWSFTLVAWWLYTVYRTEQDYAQPLVGTINTGRDFVFYALLVPLFASSLRRRELRNTVLATVAIFAVVDGLAYVVASADHGVLSSFVHSTQVRSLNGLTRIYASAGDLFAAVLPLAVGAAALCTDRRSRLAAGAIAALALLDVLAGQTRAEYIGSLAGITFALIVWMTQSGERVRRARRGVLRAMCAVVLVSAALAVINPGGKVTAVFGGVFSRITSISSTATSANPSESTVAVREQEAGLIEEQLAGHWIIGEGFPDPSYIYNDQLVDGSIRNTDVGVLNAAATMGIVGTVIYFVPIVGVLIGLGLKARSGVERESWMAFGVFGWCVSALVTAVTLVTLFSPTGVVASAVVIGLGGALLTPD
jgi:hypothetical protein